MKSKYIIQPSDVGKTCDEIPEKSDKELTPEEKKLINDLLFRGWAAKKYYVNDDFLIVLRTISPQSVQLGWKILRNSIGDEKMFGNEQSNYIKLMAVAKHLMIYGNNDFTSDNFEKEEEIIKRFEFVKNNIPAIIVDKIYEFQDNFLQIIDNAISVQKVENF